MRLSRTLSGTAMLLALPLTAVGQAAAELPPAPMASGWRQVYESASRQGPVALLHWTTLSRRGAEREGWVRWNHGSSVPLPGGGGEFQQRVARMRFDCAGRRWRELGSHWYEDYVDERPRVSSRRAGPWTAPDTTRTHHWLMEMACLSLPLGGGSPLAVPEERWMRVGRVPNMRWTVDVDAAGARREGDRVLVWTRRDYHEDRPLYTTDGTFDRDYTWTVMHCTEGWSWPLRVLHARGRTVVDSTFAPLDPVVPEGPRPLSATIRMVCGGR